jgi:hypothetical protein
MPLEDDLEPNVDVEPDVSPEDVSPAPETPEPEFVSVRDVATQYGYSADGYEDDESFLKDLTDRAKKSSEYEQQIQQWKPFVDYAQQALYRQNEQSPAAKQSPEPEKPTFWNPPVQWNPSWLSTVRVDPDTGDITSKNPEDARDFQRYLSFRNQEQEKFWQGPHQYLEPYIQHREQGLLQQVQSLIEERLQAQVFTQDARQFAQQNAEWLYAKDAQGQIQFEAGRPKVSEEGAKFQGYIQEAHKMGLNYEAQKNYALRMLHADRVLSGTADPDTKRQANNRKIQMNAANFQPNSAPPEVIPSEGNQGMTLAQMLKAELQNAGVTDQVFASAH